jgi:pimeloyl-ACP methyl ester carboxylesterase
MRSDHLLHSHRYGGLAADELPGGSDRPPIVLLHGLTFDRTMWRPALERLAVLDPERRAIALDLPGHGESPDAESYSLESVVEAVRAAVVDASIEAPVLVGHSASASTVALYAATYPTSGFIAVEGTFVVTPFAGMVQSLAPVLRGDGFDAAWSRISEQAFRLAEVPDDVRRFVRETSRARRDVVLGYWQDLLERSPEELTRWIDGGAARIQALGLPIRSVVGQSPSPAEVAWIATNLPALETLVWPGSGHFPHLAHPQAFAELLASAGLWTGRPMEAASA